MRDRYVRGTKTTPGYVVWGNTKFKISEITRVKGVSVSSVLVALRDWDITIHEFMFMSWGEARELAKSRMPVAPIKERKLNQKPSFASEKIYDQFLFGGMKCRR